MLTRTVTLQSVFQEAAFHTLDALSSLELAAKLDAPLRLRNHGHAIKRFAWKYDDDVLLNLFNINAVSQVQDLHIQMDIGFSNAAAEITRRNKGLLRLFINLNLRDPHTITSLIFMEHHQALQSLILGPMVITVNDFNVLPFHCRQLRILRLSGVELALPLTGYINTRFENVSELSLACMAFMPGMISSFPRLEVFRMAYVRLFYDTVNITFKELIKELGLSRIRGLGLVFSKTDMSYRVEQAQAMIEALLPENGSHLEELRLHPDHEQDGLLAQLREIYPPEMYNKLNLRAFKIEEPFDFQP
ncbi:hypothetical protein EDD21DRAFT_413225 [Dissophora ornata]|nr:hypothetical protein BGZ58_000485 [Dissophora ornata]KAI8603224.1 hypothetical protein EDD21DRAFT_413225 [Dissophora ornata]